MEMLALIIAALVARSGGEVVIDEHLLSEMLSVELHTFRDPVTRKLHLRTREKDLPRRAPCNILN